jgi:hypothetical protein
MKKMLHQRKYQYRGRNKPGVVMDGVLYHKLQANQSNLVRFCLKNEI